MQKGKCYHIKDMAKLFHLPVSTLHYWEKENLIKTNRTQNQYRIFQSREFFEIWEVQMYRSLQVPVGQLKQLKSMNVEEIHHLLDDKKKVLEEEIREKERALGRLESYKKGVLAWEKLNSASTVPLFEPPAFDCLYEDLFSKETMEQTIEHPMDCCLFFSKGNWHSPKMCIPPREGISYPQEKVWNYEKSGCDGYVLAEIRTLVDHMEVNTIQEKIQWLACLGYETEHVIASYLFTAAQGDQRYEYHKAWFGVKRKE